MLPVSEANEETLLNQLILPAVGPSPPSSHSIAHSSPVNSRCNSDGEHPPRHDLDSSPLPSSFSETNVRHPGTWSTTSSGLAVAVDLLEYEPLGDVPVVDRAPSNSANKVSLPRSAARMPVDRRNSSRTVPLVLTRSVWQRSINSLKVKLKHGVK
jgi:hypothetical protein